MLILLREMIFGMVPVRFDSHGAAAAAVAAFPPMFCSSFSVSLNASSSMLVKLSLRSNDSSVPSDW